MAPVLEQSTFNATAKWQTRTCRVTFTRPTTPGNLIVVICVAGGGSAVGNIGPEGFTFLQSRGIGDIHLTCWYRQAAPSLTSVQVTSPQDRSLQVRALEYSGVAQSNVLDRVIALSADSNVPNTGTSGDLTQGDSLVIGVVANQYASTTQSGFAGGLTRLFESVSPTGWIFGSNADWERSRLTVHQTVTSSINSFWLTAFLSSWRRWIAFLLCFRGGSTGPARMTSRNATPVLTGGGRGDLTVFGPLRSVSLTSNGPMIQTGGPMARIGPFDYQYRLGGWSGLLIGHDTPYRVESVEGLEGWQVRTSDDDLPRGDGALRGVDLQGARQILFKINASGTREQVEEAMDTLYRALIPQRDSDLELIWRHPGRPLRTVYYRPVDLARELSLQQALVNKQAFALRAADPRHYSALTHHITVPVTPTGSLTPAIISAVNTGNGPAYPEIRITGPASDTPVTRVSLVNNSTDVTFDVSSVLPRGSTLIGDMSARATGAPRSIVTIDGQSKYGAWTHPRKAFSINPGSNDLVLYTEPSNSPVTCTVEYRETWSG